MLKKLNGKKANNTKKLFIERNAYGGCALRFCEDLCTMGYCDQNKGWWDMTVHQADICNEFAVEET